MPTEVDGFSALQVNGVIDRSGSGDLLEKFRVMDFPFLNRTDSRDDLVRIERIGDWRDLPIRPRHLIMSAIGSVMGADAEQEIGGIPFDLILEEVANGFAEGQGAGEGTGEALLVELWIHGWMRFGNY